MALQCPVGHSSIWLENSVGVRTNIRDSLRKRDRAEKYNRHRQSLRICEEGRCTSRLSKGSSALRQSPIRLKGADGSDTTCLVEGALLFT